MLSKNDILLIRSLEKKKYREFHKLFVVEGIKSLKEVLVSKFKVKKIFSLEKQLPLIDSKNIPTQIINEDELKKISFLKTPYQLLALCCLPEAKAPNYINEDWALALDKISDPGNLGTLIRAANWFGIPKIYAGAGSVDFFNPKVIQASMGAFCSVELIYCDLEDLFKQSSLPIWGAFMEGEPIYIQKNLPSKAILLLGNEASGISKELETYLNKKISIPAFSKKNQVESLNVAIAGSILLSHLRGKPN